MERYREKGRPAAVRQATSTLLRGGLPRFEDVVDLDVREAHLLERLSGRHGRALEPLARDAIAAMGRDRAYRFVFDELPEVLRRLKAEEDARLERLRRTVPKGVNFADLKRLGTLYVVDLARRKPDLGLLRRTEIPRDLVGKFDAEVAKARDAGLIEEYYEAGSRRWRPTDEGRERLALVRFMEGAPDSPAAPSQPRRRRRPP